MSTSPFQILVRIVAEHPQAAADSFPRSLDASTVRNKKPQSVAETISDGGGLSLYIPPTGAKVWRYRYRAAGKPGILTIGRYPEISLADARTAHRGARWLVQRGEHPITYIDAEIARVEAENAARELSTFRAVATEWMKKSMASLSPRTCKHRGAMLENHVFPILGNRPVADIRRKELVNLLKSLDLTTPETAKHCRIYIKQAFDWAVGEELIAGNPTPSTKDVQIKRAGERAPKHRKALPINRIGEFIRTVKDAPESDPTTKAALQLLILTWCRTAEVVAAKWKEFDLDSAVWRIPAERMKAQELHTVYLSNQAVELIRNLRNLTGEGVFLFPNRRRPRDHMNRMTLTNWRKRWGFDTEMEIHGLRATCSTWANESGRYRPDVIEVALAHKENDRVRAAYNRAKFIDELRLMWQDWANVCEEQEAVARSNNVIPISSKTAA